MKVAFGWLKFQFWFRLISCGLIISFLSYDIVWANPSSFLASFEKPVYSLPSTLSGVGKVSNILYSSQKNGAPVVYHIQDAHAVFEAQENMSKLLELLIQKESIDLVLVEGGAGNVNLTPLRNIAWKKVRRRVAADFLRQGKITGEEFLQLSTNYSFDLYGVEDPVLYRQNLSVFLDSQGRREELLKALGQFESVLYSLEGAIYPAKYREVVSQARKWQSGTGDLSGYLNLLKKSADDLKISARIVEDLEQFKKAGNSRSLDGGKVLSGIADLETRIRGAMLDERARKLWRIEETLRLLKRLFSFELSSEEYGTFLEEPSQFASREISAALGSFDISDSRFQKSLNILENERTHFLKFYELARKRDSAFMGNIKKVLQERNARKTVLITGGFHSENLGRLLKENGISRVLLSPEITSVAKDADLQYVRILRSKSKSTLRAPATFGTPVYFELESALRREQSRELAGHINRLIGLLDIDSFLQPKEVKAQYARSELRMESFINLFSTFSLSHGTAIQWISIGGAGILGGILAILLFKRWRSKSSRKEQEPIISAGPEPKLTKTAAFVQRFDDTPSPSMVLRTPLRDISSYARAFGAESQRFFETKLPVIPEGESLPPPPFELPLPVAVNAIPADLDAKGKAVFVLNEVLRAMDAMDDTVRSHQKSAAEQALHRTLSNGGTADVARFRQYLEEDIHAFFQMIFREMQKFSETQPDPRTYAISEEIEQQSGRFPRFIKFLLTENPTLLEDPEVRGLMSRISARLGSKPPVAKDLEAHLERVFLQVMEERNQQSKPVPIPAPPKPEVPKLDVPRSEILKLEAPKPEAPKSPPKEIVDVPKIRGQLEDIQRMKERLEADFSSLEAELSKLDAEYKELQESIEEARAANDVIIQEALSPSIEAYDARLQKLRFNRQELETRLGEIKGEEARLSGLLDEEGGAARSELRDLESIFLIATDSFWTSGLWVAGIGIAVSCTLYLVMLYKAIGNTQAFLTGTQKDWLLNRESAQAFLASTHKDWLLDRKKIFKETVPLKPDEKIDLSDIDDQGPFIGTGVFAGWGIGGWLLYQCYYSWDIASKVLFTFSPAEGSGQPDFWTWGVVLWLLEIFAAPFVGGLFGILSARGYEAFVNKCRVLFRTLRFPLQYERALRLHFLPFQLLGPRLLRQNAHFFSKMNETTVAAIFQDWINRGEPERIKMFLESRGWRGKKQTVIEHYKDAADFELAKQALLYFASENDLVEIPLSIAHWKSSLDGQKINGAHLLKDIIPELIKTEKTAANVSIWMTRLLGDSRTPWPSGFATVKQYVETLKQFDVLKSEAQRKFGLDEKELLQVDEHIQKWRERIPQAANKEPGATLFSGAILAKAVGVVSTKEWFLNILAKVLEIDASLFSPSRQKDLLLRFDKILSYEFVLSNIMSSKDETERLSLKNEVLAFEAFTKGNGLDLAAAFTDPLKNIEKKPASIKIAIMQGFRVLNPSVYQKDSQAAGRTFQLLADKEILKARLAANNGSASSIEGVESKAVLGSMDAIEHLKGFYGVLLERADVKSQGVLLDMCARAPPEVLSVFLKSRETLVNYYLAHPSNRDYDNLPVLADKYRKRYGGLYSLTDPLLNLLSDPSKSASERLEEARKQVAGQTLARLGFPENVINSWDAISLEEMIRAVGDVEARRKHPDQATYSDEEIQKEGESLISRRAQNPVVQKAVSKMGHFGLYSHWESAKPAYYLEFLQETKGIDSDFFKPGEKFRVSYDEVFTPVRKAAALLPVADAVQTMKTLVRNLRERHPNLYENFLGPKRVLIDGKVLEDFIDEKTLMRVADQFRKKITDWPVSENERIEMALLIYQIVFSNEITSLSAHPEPMEEARYWQEVLNAFHKRSGLSRDSKFSRAVASRVRAQIDELVQEAGAGREGVVQFILTRGSISDYLRGEISEDCISESRNLHFTDTLGLPADPAFLSFRMVENGRWIGNVYAIVLKDASGKFVFYLDNMPVRLTHPLTAQAKAAKFVANLSRKLKDVLEENGFDYWVTAPDPSSREHIRSSLHSGKDESRTVTKPGGFSHQSGFDVSSEYIQGLGTLSASIPANGTWVALDNRAAREAKRKAELSELERQIRAIADRRKSLTAIGAEKAKKVHHLEAGIESAGKGARRVTAQALQEAATKETLEFQKISDESRTLEEQLHAMQSHFEGLKTGPGRSELRLEALAQMLGPEAFFVIFFGGLFFLVLGLLVLAALENRHGEGARRDDEYTRSLERHSDNIRYDPRAFGNFHERKDPFLLELESLFKTVLKQVSPEMAKLVPPHIFFPITGFGMGLSKQVMNLLSVVRFVLTVLKEQGSLVPFLKEQDYYKRFKKETVALGIVPEFDVPGTVSSFTLQKRGGEDIHFSLEISDRVADDLLRGDISRDCTGLGACAAFYETIPQFLLDPGFLNLKLRMQGRWVGNIYVIVMKSAGKPILVIDAVQLHSSYFLWPMTPEKIAQKAVNEIAGWAKTKNFKAVYMSRFVSNFYYLYQYFDARYRPSALEIEKVGGFEHLKNFGFWDEERPRNQYIETFSPRWNEPLKNIHPNLANQTLLLRPVWAEGPLAPSGDPEPLLKSTAGAKQARSEVRGAPAFFKNFQLQKLLLISVLAMSFFGSGCASYGPIGITTSTPSPVYTESAGMAYQKPLPTQVTTAPKNDDAIQVTKNQTVGADAAGGLNQEEGIVTTGGAVRQIDQESPPGKKVEQITGREIGESRPETSVTENSSVSPSVPQEKTVPAPVPLERTQAVSPEKTGAPSISSDVSIESRDTRDVQGSLQDQRAKQLENERAGHLLEIERLTSGNMVLAQNLAATERLAEDLSHALAAQGKYLSRIDRDLQKLKAGVDRLNRTLDGMSPKIAQLEKESGELAVREREMEKRFVALESQSAQQSQILSKRMAGDKPSDSNSNKSRDGSSFGKWFFGAFAAFGIGLIIAMTILLKRFAKLIREAKDVSRQLPRKAQASAGEEPAKPSPEVFGARQELEELSSQTREARKTLQEMLAELDRARTDLTGVSEASQAKTRELAETSAEESALKDRIETLKQERVGLEIRRQVLLDEAERLETQNRELAALKAEEPESGDLEKSEALRARNEESLNEIERLKQTITELTGKEAKREEGIRTLEEVTAKISAAVEESERREQELGQKERKLGEVTGAIEAKEQELAGKLGKLSEVSEAVTTKSGELTAVQERIETLQAEVSELEKRKESLVKAVDEFVSTQSQLLEVQTQLSGVNRQYAGAKAEYDRITGLKDAATGDLRALQDQLLQTESAAGAIGARIADLREQAQKKEELLTRIAELTNELEAKTRALQTAKTELSGIETRKDADTSRLAALRDELSQKERELAALKEETSRLSAEFETLRRNITSLSESAASKQKELAELEENKVRLLAETGTLEDQSRKLEDSKKKLAEEQAARKTAEETLAEEGRKVRETAGHLRTVGERLSQTVAQLAELETRTGALDSELGTEKEKRLKAEEAAALAQADRDRLKADLTHSRQEKDVLEEALREAGKTTKGAAADAVLDGRESLETLLSELPEDLWQLLGRHFPGQNRSDFQLTVSSVTKELVQAWNRSPFFRRVVKNLVLYRSHFAWFQKQPFYRVFKKECETLGLSPDFDKPGEHVRFNLAGDPAGYSLELSKRDAEYLLRGFLSGDCTNCGPGYVTGSFLAATGSHITDPGFFNFKILRNKEWVGNVYAMAIRDKNKPVLVIDALQIPWQSAAPLFIPFDLSQSAFPVKTEQNAVALAEVVIGALSRYSADSGFKELWLSSFVSNFSALKQHFYYTHQQEFNKRVTEKAKIGGWSALDALGYEGHPYVESIGNPEAKKVWESTETPAAAAVETLVPAKEKVNVRDVKGIARQIKESVAFSYGNLVQRGMEFIVKVPGAPVRWVAFDEGKQAWLLFEKAGEKIETFALFSAETGERDRSAACDLSTVLVDRGGRKIPLSRVLMLPPLKQGVLQTHVEEGGVLLLESGEIKVLPFSKKGFIVTENGLGAFFVHPGGDPGLETKGNLSLPLRNHYEVIRSQYPNARFILGWHTNPGGEPFLHGAEETEIWRAGMEGFQLVVSPSGISLVRYFKDSGSWKKRVLFTKKLEEDWTSELEAALEGELASDENFSASGYQLKPEEKILLKQAIDGAKKTVTRDIKGDVQEIFLELTASQGIKPESLESFLGSSDFKLVVVNPPMTPGARAPPMGLGVNLGKPGRDVFASFQVHPKHKKNGFEITIYIGAGIYELAGERERLEIIAHELYQAFYAVNSQNPRKYPLDTDLESKIDREIRNAGAWESRIPQEERQDLGLSGGWEQREDSHVRARAFARLVGAQSADGIGTTYTALLRNAWALASRFSGANAWGSIPALPEGSFRYTRDSSEKGVSFEMFQGHIEMFAYIHQHKEEDITRFLARKNKDGKRVMLLNTNAPTPWILRDIQKIIKGLTLGEKLTALYIDLPPKSQRLVDEYLRTGRSSPGLLKEIAARFPAFLPEEFQKPELYENILRAVYEYNLAVRADKKIKVTCYYQGRVFPSMPEQGGVLRRPEGDDFGPPGFPFGAADRNNFPPGINGTGDFPFDGEMGPPPIPLTPGVKESFEQALSLSERNPDAVILFVKPLDEFLPGKLANRPNVASILQIDQYTGFGPEKPENQLALFMAEQASPFQKTFALPILKEAPFFEESINPGIPQGVRFNAFNAYPDLILSTAGDRDEPFEPVPDDLVPEEISPRVPVLVRSEIRDLKNNPMFLDKLNERRAAIKELERIGEPAVAPLLDTLHASSVSSRLAAVQILGVIGDSSAEAPLNQVAEVKELKRAVNVALSQIKSRNKVVVRQPPALGHALTVPKPSSIYSSFDSRGSYAFVRALLKETLLAVDIDAEALIRKRNGKVELLGWGFIEAIMTLESKLPDELSGKIRIRVINLNPGLSAKEIQKAFAITTGLKGMIDIVDIPLRHRAFKGLGVFLEKDALKIAAERNQDLWKNNLDILVKEPGANEVVDGRKLFLMALLHRAVSGRLSEGLRTAVVRLLRDLGGSSVGGARAFFIPEDRAVLGLEFLAQIDRANKLLSSMA